MALARAEVTLFIGTIYFLWQFTALGLLEAGVAEVILLPTFGINLIIEAIVCPVLIKSVSPKLKTWDSAVATTANGGIWRKHEPTSSPKTPPLLTIFNVWKLESTIFGQ